LRLPIACFFSSVDELAAKISIASSIWEGNKADLVSCANSLRKRHSFIAAQSSLSSALNL
jgi:hypothetical protein